MIRRMAMWISMAMISMSAAGGSAEDSASQGGDHVFRLTETRLTIPQVDYEDAIYYDAGDPLPHIDFDRVHMDRVVDKEHAAVILETDYLRLTVLPEMGRVYSMEYLPTGHNVLWKNDIVRPGGGSNPCGWWLWIGGIEYTLPGYEHGTTFAMPWDYVILEDGDSRKALRMQVTEPLTGLKEHIDISVYPGHASFEATIRIWNPGPDTVEFAHWVNPMWTPGGHNELTDSTEFIIPTKRILIEDRWQKNLGPSPQQWADNPLRHIRNWAMGDIMADDLDAGFYGAYSHDEEEGVVRVFDPVTNPGMDMWTYGFHPTRIPMGSGAPNKGYAEMWGGTVKLFPHERRPLAPGASLRWSEWMYAFQRTAGLTAANDVGALNCDLGESGESLSVAFCPARTMRHAVVDVRVAGRTEHRSPLTRVAPDQPFQGEYELPPGTVPAEVCVVVVEGGSPVLQSGVEGS